MLHGLLSSCAATMSSSIKSQSMLVTSLLGAFLFRSLRPATPAMAATNVIRDVGTSGVEQVEIPESPIPETYMCNGMITINRAIGVHPKLAEPAAFACLLLLLLDL